jgi:probable addiction module antidote protein
MDIELAKVLLAGLEE